MERSRSKAGYNLGSWHRYWLRARVGLGMLKLDEHTRVWLILGKTDMRKSINGLSDIVANQLGLDALSGQYFVFCGRRRNTLKIIYWDRNGYALWYKRLEVDRFRWPRNEDEAQAITGEQLGWLLSGLDIGQAHQRRLFSA
jgi:transposase